MARSSAFARQIDIVNSQLQGEARKALMIQAAQNAFAAAQSQNRSVLGHDPAYQQIVDGSQGAALESVQRGGTIVYLFAVGGASLTEATDDAIDLIVRLSPVLTGKYRDSNLLMVNGALRDADIDGVPVDLKETDVVSLVNLLPYARKIEKGLSPQAPNGVYEAAFAVLNSRYGNLLRMNFTYEVYPGYEAGSGRSGGKPSSRSDLRRAAAFPTITLQVK